tara:strand:- start:330 stop:590 length:261 start_codon:yes stop_codon:yes gene_type:complete
MTKKDDDGGFMSLLSDLIDEVFSDRANGKPKKTDTAPPVKEHFPNLYESIEDFTAQTGKRFRMTKAQKSRNLTREQAFNELYLGDN